MYSMAFRIRMTRTYWYSMVFSISVFLMSLEDEVSFFLSALATVQTHLSAYPPTRVL